MKDLEDIKEITIEKGQGIEEEIIKLLVKKKLTIATAESCTGGLIAATLINVSGSSQAFAQGYVTYSNKAKRKALGVKKSTLDQYGAVSKKVARQMAIGAAMDANTDIAIASTGIAGPTGGTKDKPVGLVYVGFYVKDRTYVKEFRFAGDRNEVRNLTVVNSLYTLLELLK